MWPFRKKLPIPPEYERLSLSAENGKWNFEALVKHPIICLFAKEIGEFFRDSDGVYSVSFCFFDEISGPIEVLFQRKEGKTQAQIISELKEELVALKKGEYQNGRL